MAGATTDNFKCSCKFKAFLHHSYTNCITFGQRKENELRQSIKRREKYPCMQSKSEEEDVDCLQYA